MRQVSVHAAEADLSGLIEAALAGEEVIVAKDGKAAVRLAPVTRGAFRIGLFEGQLGAGPDFFEPLDETDLPLWEGGPLS